MGRATEELAHRAGPGIGGLLNVTFGNAPELIIALFALQAGPAGGRQGVDRRLDPRQPAAGAGRGDADRRLGKERQKFVAEAAMAQATMLLLAAVALVLPAMFLLARGDELPALGEEATNYPSDVEQMSFAVAIVLLLSYFAGLWFSLKTHNDVFNPTARTRRPSTRGASRRSVLMLAGAGRRGRLHVGDPRPLDRGGLRGHRAVAVLRLADHRRRRRQRGRALGRDLLRGARQDGPRDLDRGRLERPDRAVRDARARAAELRDGPVPAGDGVQRASRSAPCCSRCSSPRT